MPTFWTLSELQLLVGTTLAPAVASKMKSLRREYELLCSVASKTKWYHVVRDRLEYDDWLLVDAMYRSRALDYPGIGHCMVPCIDLANHTAGEATTSVYEKDDNGNAILLLRDGQSVEEGQEVTITYGDEKGACEMLFSYGFLEQDRTSAETLFLGLTISDDDPQRTGKTRVADCAPGFKIIDTGDGEIDWTGDFIWLLCVNSDDGLTFQLARTVDGADDEMEAFFQDTELKHGAAQLYSLLGKSDLWDVYRLRAIAILQQKVFDQMQVLYGTQDEMEAVPHGPETGMRERCYQQAMQLRKLEFELLERAYEDFEKQVSWIPILCIGASYWYIVAAADCGRNLSLRRAMWSSSTLRNSGTRTSKTSERIKIMSKTWRTTSRDRRLSRPAAANGTCISRCSSPFLSCGEPPTVTLSIISEGWGSAAICTTLTHKASQLGIARYRLHV